jgi:hypothetical protein
VAVRNFWKTSSTSSSKKTIQLISANNGACFHTRRFFRQFPPDVSVAGWFGQKFSVCIKTAEYYGQKLFTAFFSTQDFYGRKHIVNMKKFLIIALSSLALMGCGTFDHSYFIEQAFGVNLTEYIKGKDAKYSNGFLEISNISTNEFLYQKFFIAGYKTTSFLECGKREFSTDKLGEIRYIEGKRFDGYLTVIFYIPKENRLYFAYATGLGG